MKYHKLENVEKPLDSPNKFSYDLTLEFKSLTKPKIPLQSISPLLQTDNSDFLRITSENSRKLKNIALDLRELEDTLKKSSFFLNNDAKVSEITIKIKENLSEVQILLGSLKSSFDNDFSFNSSTELISKTILEILQHQALILTDSFQKTLKHQAEDIRKREEKFSNFKPGYRTMNNPSENLRNRPMFLETSQEKTIVEKDSEDLKYDRKVDQSRNESIKNIERLLHEVGRTFQRLGTMVKMQEIMVDRIDKNLEHTELNVRKGKENLMKYYENVSSNRGLCFRVLAILFIFAVIYIVFLL